MSFIEKLSELRASEVRKAELSEARSESEKAEREKQEAERKEKTAELEKLVEEKLLPILETVRESYTDGKGKLGFNSGAWNYDHPHHPHDLFASVALNWDERTVGSIRQGKRLALVWSKPPKGKEYVAVVGAGKSRLLSRTRINLGWDGWNENSQLRVKNAVLKILSTPDACSWSSEQFTSADWR